MDSGQAAAGRFRGTIEYIRLIDLIQVSCLAKLSHIIKVDSPAGTGRVYLDSGNVVHAESSKAIGEEAFWKLLRWERGHFETLPLPKNETASINRPWEYLLINAISASAKEPGSENAAQAAKDLSRGFWGTINDIGLAELVQLICLDSVNRVVEVRSETLTGTIHISDGQVCHARTGGFKGREAFFKMLAAGSGTFVTTIPSSQEVEVTIDIPWEQLLIEAMRFIDELSGKGGEDETLERVESLRHKIQQKKMSEKIRLALTADKETRSILIQDSNRIIQVAVISNAKITDGEVAAIACSRHIDEEVLRKIAADKEWIRLYSVRLALSTNPKTPVSISRRLVSTLNHKDLKNISRSKSVPTLVANEAQRHLPK
jgi:hypothetical protein